MRTLRRKKRRKKRRKSRRGRGNDPRAIAAKIAKEAQKKAREKMTRETGAESLQNFAARVPPPSNTPPEPPSPTSGLFGAVRYDSADKKEIERAKKKHKLKQQIADTWRRKRTPWRRTKDRLRKLVGKPTKAEERRQQFQKELDAMGGRRRTRRRRGGRRRKTRRRRRRRRRSRRRNQRGGENKCCVYKDCPPCPKCPASQPPPPPPPPPPLPVRPPGPTPESGATKQGAQFNINQPAREALLGNIVGFKKGALKKPSKAKSKKKAKKTSKAKSKSLLAQIQAGKELKSAKSRKLKPKPKPERSALQAAGNEAARKFKKSRGEGGTKANGDKCKHNRECESQYCDPATNECEDEPAGQW